MKGQMMSETELKNDITNLEYERDLYEKMYHRATDMIHRITNIVFDGKYNGSKEYGDFRQLESEVDDVCDMLNKHMKRG